MRNILEAVICMALICFAAFVFAAGGAIAASIAAIAHHYFGSGALFLVWVAACAFVGGVVGFMGALDLLKHLRSGR